MKLILETSYDFQLEESKSGKDKKLYIVGIFSSADVKNANGRRYKREVLEREINSLVEKKISQKCCWGQLGHPVHPDTDLDKVAMQTMQLEWKGNNVFGRAKILQNTPMGSIAAELLKEGSLGVSSRGLGTVSEDGWVNEDFRLLTYDLVSDPSNPGSNYINGIYEAKEFFIETTEDTKDKLKEENIDEEKAKQMYLDNVLNFIDNLAADDTFLRKASSYKIEEKEKFEKIKEYMKKSEFWLKTALESSELVENKQFYKILDEHYKKLNEFIDSMIKFNVHK